MASIEVIVRDDQGKILRQSVDEDVKLSSLSLRGVESAVERWRHKVLPKVEETSLEAAQQEFTEAQKANLIYDGTNIVR
jgi:predicted GTPase